MSISIRSSTVDVLEALLLILKAEDFPYTIFAAVFHGCDPGFINTGSAIRESDCPDCKYRLCNQFQLCRIPIMSATDYFT